MEHHIHIFVPASLEVAIKWLRPALSASGETLMAMSETEFGRSWAAIQFIYPGLHPDGTEEPGDLSLCDMDEPAWLAAVDPRLANPYHAETGWPLILLPVKAEAWRRHEIGKLAEDDLYNLDAQRAGFGFD